MSDIGVSHDLGVRARAATDAALAVIDANVRTFAVGYPDDTTIGGIYHLRRRTGLPDGANTGWTTGFLPGMLWLASELAPGDNYRRLALRHIGSFRERIENAIDIETHDLGFLYTLSCAIAWREDGDIEARDAALAAARHLMTRYHEKARIIQAWGDLDNLEQRGRTIIDSLMNTPLLFWASEVTGDATFANAATAHVRQLRDHIIRPDSSTFHTYYWDTETGAALRGGTAQGHADDSCWARGQVWGIYGFAINYRHTGDETFLEASRRCADYFLDHLPEDSVPYWDLAFGEGADAPRDSSSGAIAATGLLELAGACAGPDADRYRDAAFTILSSLMSLYTPSADEDSNALLAHGVYDEPKGVGVDEGNLWGDYFYLEALTRVVVPDWTPYW
ncbi:glycoside hydrolase family 88 protein [Demequina lutea]|uniref:Unsaturated chondroitin disaccharide hydrolase n=1 Tax=Demequina lutea TaxID=431489 RepID=A0A7Y9ZB77_9MICO|nr:glycoside hydrolase family 88 protein [Demequina lutea]NYI42174.1 unsaturated chondroitin disaccharide hydrolase [Demequina lutea]